MEILKPNEQRAKTAIIFIWAVLALEIISLFSGYLQYDLLQSAANGQEITIEIASANDTREQIIGIISIIINIISIVTFIMWFRRAYFNLHQKVKHLAYSEGWAAGSWFVPILSLFRPFQIMKELYTETKIAFEKNNILGTENIGTSALGWWWTLWIISSFLGQFVFRYSQRANGIDEYLVSTVASMIQNIVGIPLAIITVKVIKDYSSIEYMLADIKDEEKPNTSSEAITQSV